VDGDRVNRGRADSYSPTRNARAIGLKHKDLVGIPWRVAFALQADGWYLRSDIIWAKPNPMPESVTDRPTKAHEYLFLLSKSPRYYYDADAVAEPLTDSSVARLSQPSIDQQEGSWRVPGKTNGAMKAVGGPSWQERKAAGATAGNVGVSATYQNGVHGKGLSHDLGGGPTRNLRSVWTIATQPYPGAHFATFPPKLVEPCIKAGCPEGGTVLDPFAGSGTTGMVAQSLSRRAVLIDLSVDYLKQLMDRNRDIPLGLGA
jgi:DNA modification methylase